MALLQLQDIGKIYVSEGSVAVGIRGVNLSFDRGEFVAITGMSGSGKSTLLNVISGMDSYEEGELYIEGQSTSHYLQPDWEEYREKYISFIFQDYNIIESFTVLQNVELALMHIEDKKERRARAVELLKRVGLGDRMRQKGSKLSGGQKQRTVIARALAKDSPIILADEPTGNLDSVTSAEIINLLKEVSKDKLLIVVTHNFEQVEAHATRHVRIFDGAVESDHVIASPEVSVEEPEVQETKKETSAIKKQIRNGFVLGRTIFTSKPKLSIFLCLLMLVGTLGIFLITAFCGEASMLFEKHYMFEPIEGRVVVTTQNGVVMSEDEVAKLAKEYGAESYLRYDMLLDEYDYNYFYCEELWTGTDLKPAYGKDYGDNIIGRYPEKANEVFLYMPIALQPYFGESELVVDTIILNQTEYNITGIKYFYDNTLSGEVLLTEEGFEVYTAMYYLTARSSVKVNLSVKDSYGQIGMIDSFSNFLLAFDIEDGKAHISSPDYDAFMKAFDDGEVSTEINISSSYRSYDYYDGVSTEKSYVFEYVITDEALTETEPVYSMDYRQEVGVGNHYLALSPELVCTIAQGVLSQSYRQASLFFEDNKTADAVALKLRDAGYVAVPADTTYSPDMFEIIGMLVACLMMAFVWVMSIVFLAFFINLCSSRTVGAFKGDMAIMRSMGIPVKVIRIGMYVRMLFALIPAYIIVVIVAYLIYTSPKMNPYFMYLYPWQYAVIFAGMLFLMVRVTRKQIQKLFGESVKKSLKGGDAE